MRVLLRILTNLNVDRGRRVQRTPDLQPLEEGDYYLANKLAAAEVSRHSSRSRSCSGCRKTAS